jgi:hypothetical protein
MTEVEQMTRKVNLKRISAVLHAWAFNMPNDMPAGVMYSHCGHVRDTRKAALLVCDR